MMALLIGMVGPGEIPESVLTRRHPASTAEGDIHRLFHALQAFHIETDSSHGNPRLGLDVRNVYGILTTVASDSSFAGSVIEPTDSTLGHTPIMGSIREGA
jgi:hypothetical protein